MLIQATIQKWGNSLGLRLTGPARSIPNFKENMRVNISINESGIQVIPLHQEKKFFMFKEKELLKGLSSKTAHSDALATLNGEEFGD